jgi:hypothetical protein
MLSSAIWYKFTDVSKERIVSIFSVEAGRHNQRACLSYSSPLKVETLLLSLEYRYTSTGSHGVIPRREPGQHVGFLVDKAALEQVFSEYFGFACQSFSNFSIIIITRGWHNRPVCGRSVEWTQLESTPSPPHYTNLKNNRLSSGTAY